MMNTWNTLAQ
jgi:putative effector of murein hydrolase LrgA (UPF0299 family)